MEALRRPGLNDSLVLPCLLGLISAAIAVAPDWQVKALVFGACAALALVWWTTGQPHRWLGAFFVCLLLTPPIPGPVGDAGLHVAPALGLVGLFVGLLRMSQWTGTFSTVAVAFSLFTAALLASVAAAALYSGEAAGVGS